MPTTLPLAPSQQMMWEFMTALDPDRPGDARLVVVEFRRLRGTLRVDALRQAMQDVVDRHDALRMRFDRIGADPAVTILPHVDSPLEYVDLTGLPPREQRARVEQIAYEHRNVAFDPGRAPLWRAALIRLSATEHVLALCFFHMVSDGWSCRVFVEDLCHAYAARLGAVDPQPPLGVDFAGIAALQEAELAGGGIDAATRAGWWGERLRPVEPYQLFPAPAPAPDVALSAEVATRFAFPPEITAWLRPAARAERTSPYVLLLAAYLVLLSLRAGRRRMVLGTTTLGRESPLSRQLIGQFTNNVYLPATVDPHAPMRAVVAAAHAALAGAIDHAAPFHRVARAVRPDFPRMRPWPDNHLFDAWFQSAASASPVLSGPGLRVEPIDVTARAAPGTPPPVLAADVPPDCLPVWVKRGSPIVVVDDDRAGGVVIRNRGVFGDDLVGGLIDDYVAVVSALVTDPGLPPARLRLPDGACFLDHTTG
ncbi:condensation domain-containing protein [Micromonospora sp. WMMC241]|uniref:condensation domain-containing protein n=1 Tax=Micromonospora sp. WMMC241 TaxID=3015159 RepID=UPI0022B66C3D|nr:condensation domain-containing protein [Micromonospora sp. WMMC241]MCZ7437005.1 condensation domain-containing protein [Micromonospora sp. WMMC241]